MEEVNFHVHDRLLYHLGKLCIPQTERAHVIWEAHSSRISGHFGVSKTMAQLQRYFYWPRMYETIFKYIKGCVMCSTSKPSNWNIGLYMPLLVPLRPWDNISMDFLEDFLCLGEDMITCMSWLIISARCAFLFHAKRKWFLNKLHICSFNRYGFIFGYLLPLFLIETLAL